MEEAIQDREVILVSDPVIDAGMRRKLQGLGARVEIVRESAEKGGDQAARLDRLSELRSTLINTYCPEQYPNPDNPGAYGQVADYVTEALGTVDSAVGT